MLKPHAWTAVLAVVSTLVGSPAIAQPPTSGPSLVLAPPPAPRVPNPELDPEALARRVGARVERLKAEEGFQGVVRIDVNGRPVVAVGVGMADPVAHRPFTADTQIEMASLGKTFTAAAILKLRDQGRLQLSDPLVKFFPDAPADKAQITVFQLLTGSSGLGPTGPRNTGLDRAGLERRVFATPLAAPPGERFIYSNAGFNLLAAIVERVSGVGYEAYLREQILSPAGARHTGYMSAYDASIAATDQRGRPIPDASWGGAAPDWNIIGAGGLVTTASDLMAFEHAFMAGKIVSSRSVTESTTGWVDQGPNAPPGKYGFGRGVFDHPVYGKVVWHNGGDQAFTTYLAELVDHQITIFVASNSEADATRMAALLNRAMFDAAAPAPGPDGHTGRP